MLYRVFIDNAPPTLVTQHEVCTSNNDIQRNALDAPADIPMNGKSVLYE